MPANTLSRVMVGSGALTVAKSVIDISAVGANLTLEPLALPIPDSARLHKLEVQFTTLVTAASIIWNLAKDAAGDYPLTPETTSAVVLGVGTATNGGFAALLDTDRVPITTQFVQGHVYLVARTNAGTLTITKAFLYWVP